MITHACKRLDAGGGYGFGFICRANIGRFEQLLASGSLSAAQIAIVTALLGKKSRRSSG